ncbi:MAG TPA: ketol-acid reductoisomerase [Sphingomicrobium sp.]|nr:ketol-acid reductoisomerase [Sphingomicrobium sp.]
MKLTRESEIDPTPLEGKRVTVVGYGNQGRAQSLNLKDSGIDVVVALREGSASRAEAEAAGLDVQPLVEAVAAADVVMLLAPDETLAGVYYQIEPHIRPAAALGFSHGLVVHFDVLKPRGDLDVFLLAPKGPGTALRSLYRDGKGMVALWAVAQDATGSAEAIALAYGRAIGCARAGLLQSSFEEEAVADLFNENAVVWGGVPELLRAGFEILVDAGISPEVAYMECVGELRLLSELIEARGIAGMREVISNTAELGAVVGGPKVVGDAVRQQMLGVLASVRSGDFARRLSDEAASGYPELRAARASARALPLEAAFNRLRQL